VQRAERKRLEVDAIEPVGGHRGQDLVRRAGPLAGQLAGAGRGQHADRPIRQPPTAVPGGSGISSGGAATRRVKILPVSAPPGGSRPSSVRPRWREAVAVVTVASSPARMGIATSLSSVPLISR